MLSDLNGASTFAITDVKLYVPIVTLSTKDNAKLSKLLKEGFKRPGYWNAYKVITEKFYNVSALIRESIDSSCQGINRLFVLDYEGGANRVTVDSHRRYFFPRVEIKDQQIHIQEKNDLIKQYDVLWKVSTCQDDDYTTGCLLDFGYLKQNYRFIARDFWKQKALGADSRKT